MAQAVILAGGYSKRTGINKMSLLYQGIPLIHHVIEAFLPHVDKIYVVTGHHHEDLLMILRKYDTVEIVLNEDYPKGMFSSVLKGAAKTEGDFFITPGDYPLLKSSTVARLLKEPGSIVVPTHGGRRGHPIKISSVLKEALLKEPITSNLKEFRDAHNPVYVEVEDEGVLVDIDTLSDFHQLNEREN